MITASEMILHFDELELYELPEGFDLASFSAAIQAATPKVIVKFIEEAIESSADHIFENLKKRYPQVPLEYKVFRKMFLDGLRGLDPRVMYKEAKKAIREHGYALGIIFVVKNILTTFILPALFIDLGLKGAAAFILIFPSNLVFVPLLIKYFSSKSHL